MRRNIMHVIHAPDPNFLGGAEMSALTILEHLPQEQFKVNALVLTGTEDNVLIRELRARGISVCIGKEVRQLTDFEGMRRSISHFRQQAPDLLHIHNTYFRASPYLPLLARLAGVGRIIVTERSNNPKHASELGRRRKWIIGRSVDKTVAVSNAVRDTLLTLYRYSPGQICVIRNAVDVDAIARHIVEINVKEVRCTLNLPDDALIVGAIANLRPEKGLLTLIEAVPIMLQSFPNIHVLLIGDGEQRPTIEKAIRDYDLAAHITMAGWCADVEPFLAAMDVFVLPSFVEGLPRTVLEAMAAARPIAATDVDGTSELITNHHTGLLVPPGNVAALGQAIVELLDNPELASTLGQNAQKTALANYGIDALIHAYLRVYQELGSA